MRRLYLLLLLPLFTSCLGFLLESSENITLSRTIDSDCKVIDVSDGIDLILSPSVRRGKVEVSTSSDMHESVKGVVIGGRLKLYITGGNHFEQVTVKASLDQFTSISASDGADVELRGVAEAYEFSVALEDNSSFEGEVDVVELYVLAESDSDLEIAGSATRAFINCDERCEVDAYDLKCREVEVMMENNCEVKISATDKIAGECLMFSELYYVGNPNITGLYVDNSSMVYKRTNNY